MTGKTPHVDDMNARSREVFRQVVEGYLETGDPVGSRTLTRTLAEQVSAATIRNVMQDLEYLGLLDSPHASAGRVPTQLGLRMFVDGLLDLGGLAISRMTKSSLKLFGRACRLATGADLARVHTTAAATLLAVQVAVAAPVPAPAVPAVIGRTGIV